MQMAVLLSYRNSNVWYGDLYTDKHILTGIFLYEQGTGKMWYGINSRQQAAGEFTYNCYYNC